MKLPFIKSLLPIIEDQTYFLDGIPVTFVIKGNELLFFFYLKVEYYWYRHRGRPH